MLALDSLEWQIDGVRENKCVPIIGIIGIELAVTHVRMVL